MLPVLNARLAVALLVPAALLTACSLETSAPAERVDTSRAELVAAMFSGAFLGSAMPGGPMMGTGHGIALIGPGVGVPMPPPSQDSIGGISGITRTQSVAFYDVNAVQQPAFDQLTTERVVATTSTAGTFQGPQGMHPFTVSQSGTTTISGLAGTETRRTVNGTSQSRVSTVMDGHRGSFQVEMSTADAIQDLVLPVPDAASTSWLIPLSGTVLHQRTTVIKPAEGASYQSVIRWRTTYDGTEIARITMEYGGTVRNCTTNLVTFAFSCA